MLARAFLLALVGTAVDAGRLLRVLGLCVWRFPARVRMVRLGLALLEKQRRMREKDLDMVLRRKHG